MMARRQSIQKLALLAAVAVLLGGCAETQLAFYTAKQVGKPSAETPQPSYKIGKPYPINGVYYYPAVNYLYRETGVASWYGAKFQGRRTANGEIFDMNRPTAAHRTLPLPSIVRVTNLENGRALTVRVNDRGPFARGRIIDLSRRAAQLLGFQYKGTAQVRVEILPAESRVLAARMATPEMRRAGLVATAALVPSRVTAQRLDPPGAVRVASNAPGIPPILSPPSDRAMAVRAGRRNLVRATMRRPVKVTEIYIQAGAFLRYSNADRARGTLDRFGRAALVRTRVGRESFYRVRLGPIRSIEEADRLLARVSALGYPKARIVVDD
jgi:peptidoglycan lytic transglycosylase